MTEMGGSLPHEATSYVLGRSRALALPPQTFEDALAGTPPLNIT